MSLLHPEFLFALAVLAIPIIIHLFNFRRFKKVIFPNVRFLRKVDLQTRSKNKLKHILVLLARLLALACLVIAFARPFLNSDDNQNIAAEQKVAIFIDNSYSMQLENEDGMLLSQALQYADKIVDAYGRDDRFLLLTNDLLPKHQFELSAEKVQEEIAGVRIGPASRSYSEIVARTSDAFKADHSNNHHLYVISDFQESNFDPINLRNDTALSTHLIKLDHLGQGNVYIDSIWFESPIRSIHNPEMLAVRVTNASSKELYDIPIRLVIEGEQKAIGNMSLKPFSTVDSVLTFTNPKDGWLSGLVTLSDSPITFDDEIYFTYQVRNDCKVSVLGDGAQRTKIERVFANDPFFEVTSTSLRSLDISSLKTQDLVILSDVEKVGTGLIKELSRFVDEGGSLCVIPSLEADRNSLNELLLSVDANTIIQKKDKALKASDLDISHPLFTDVFDQVPENMDYPSVKSYYTFNPRVRSSEQRVISLQDGGSLLSVFDVGQGKCYVFASGTDREASNLSAHSLFVTSLLRMAELSAGNPPIFQEIGKDSPLSLRLGERPADAVYEFRSPSNERSFIPEQRTTGSETRFFDRGQVSESGIFGIWADNNEVAKVAYNYDRRESEMEFLSEETIQTELERNGITQFNFISAADLDSNSPFDQGVAGKSLWRYFIILGLLFLVIEILLLKFWKS